MKIEAGCRGPRAVPFSRPGDIFHAFLPLASLTPPASGLAAAPLFEVVFGSFGGSTRALAVAPELMRVLMLMLARARADTCTVADADAHADADAAAAAAADAEHSYYTCY